MPGGGRTLTIFSHLSPLYRDTCAIVQAQQDFVSRFTYDHYAIASIARPSCRRCQRWPWPVPVKDDALVEESLYRSISGDSVTSPRYAGLLDPGRACKTGLPNPSRIGRRA